MIGHEKNSKPLAFEISVLELNLQILIKFSSVEKFRENCDANHAQEKAVFESGFETA